MAASLDWYGYDGASLQSLAGSGVGFYGSSFGASILVGGFNQHTFRSNSAGTTQGPELWNSKYDSLTGVVLGQTGVPILLKQIPNGQATINMRFTYDTAVRVQNATIRAYDRVTSTSMPSGITVALYEVNHTGTSQSADGSGAPSQPTISGAHRWSVWDGTNATGALSLMDSPGTSGLSPSGSSTTDTRHDFYLATSVSPNSLGSKLFGLYATLEYL